MQRKNRFFTFILSLVPGLGHLYLGLNKRGLQFMISAFACIVMIKLIPIIFPFVLAILWFYQLFDGLQKATAINAYVDREKPTGDDNSEHIYTVHPVLEDFDRPFLPLESIDIGRGIAPLWLGGVFILIGVLVLVRQVFPQLWWLMQKIHVGSLLLALILIGFGVWLIRKQVNRNQSFKQPNERDEEQ